jgi:membrane protease YdiL (CAAX protease family)
MDVAVVVLGIAGQALVHRKVTGSGRLAWITTGSLFALLVPLILLGDQVHLSFTTGALLSGAAAGLAFFVVVQLALGVLSRWPRFAEDVRSLYRDRGTLPLAVELGVGGLVAAGEELFWRGLTVIVLTPSLGTSGAAAASLLLSVGTYAFSRSLAVLAGAVVGGSLWSALALWSPGGLATAVGCHVTWTMLMVAFEPPAELSSAAEGRR